MKKILLLAVLCSSFSFAETTEKQTLTRGNALHGGFVALSFKLTKVMDAWYGMFGFRIGWTMNKVSAWEPLTLI